MKAARRDLAGRLFGELVSLVSPEHSERAVVLSEAFGHQLDLALAEAVEDGRQIEVARLALAEAEREIEQLQAEQQQSLADILETFASATPKVTH